MKKSFIKKNIVPLIVTVLFIGSVAVADNGSWNEPSAPLPYNKAIPIHEGTDQIKNGDLTINGVFSAHQAATFFQDAIFKGVIRGGSFATTDSTVYVGGTDKDNNTVNESLILNGNEKVNGSVTVGCVANSNNSCGASGNTTTKLCANTTGKIVFCGEDDSGGGVDSCPAGTTRLYTGDCDYNVRAEVSSSVLPKGTDAKISDVKGIQGYTFTGPVCWSGCAHTGDGGVHPTINPLNTSFTVTAIGSASVATHLSVVKSGFTQDPLACFNLPARSDTYTIPSDPGGFNEEDLIDMSINSGSC